MSNHEPNYVVLNDMENLLLKEIIDALTVELDDPRTDTEALRIQGERLIAMAARNKDKLSWE
jgi:hypothetical protein